MRALIFVFLLSAVSATFFPGQSNICDSFKRKGICLFTDLLDIYIANNYKKQIYSCCTFSDNFAKVFARTKNGKEFLKLPGSYLKPIDFDTCNIAGDGICPKCCLVKGEWTQWSQFSGCSATCDGGKKIRVRECKLPASSSGVPTCEGDAVETMSCGETPCLETKCNAAGYTYDATIMVCIKIFGNPLLNFFGAKKKCESEGGRLYIADTTAKIDFLKTVIGDSSSTGNNFLLGGFDCNGQDEFKWLDGSDVEFGDVVPPSDKDCVKFSVHDNKLKAVKCTKLTEYVCELVH